MSTNERRELRSVPDFTTRCELQSKLGVVVCVSSRGPLFTLFEGLKDKGGHVVMLQSLQIGLPLSDHMMRPSLVELLFCIQHLSNWGFVDVHTTTLFQCISSNQYILYHISFVKLVILTLRGNTHVYRTATNNYLNCQSIFWLCSCLIDCLFGL